MYVCVAEFIILFSASGAGQVPALLQIAARCHYPRQCASPSAYLAPSGSPIVYILNNPVL